MNKAFDVAVIGTIFVDIKGFPVGDYQPLGRNLGQVNFVHGGVGRNVAETMAQLETKVTFVSTVDQNGLGQEVLDRLAAGEIDLRYLKQVKQNGMGMWLAILNEKGELAGSISQMPDLEMMEEVVLSQAERYLHESKAIVLEIDLNEAIAETIVQQAAAKGLSIYGLPGNLEVVSKRQDLLRYFQCFICNHIEAERLTGLPTETLDEVKQAADRLAEKGIKQIVITMGAQGSYYYDGLAGDAGFHPAIPIQVVDTTGAGDAFFSGTIAALLKGETLAEAVRMGTLIAAWTISSSESTCTDLKERIDYAEIVL